jgi:subtilase family serine protease
VGAVPASRELHLTVALAPQDPGALASLASEVSTPGSPLFRRYLSVREFAQRCGASDAAISTVRSALSSQGLSVGAPTANGLTLPVTATAAQVEKALATPLSQVALAGGRTAYANDQAPAIPADASRYVQGIIGLSDLTLDEPQQVKAARGNAARRAARSHPSVLSSFSLNALTSQAVSGAAAPCREVEETQLFDAENDRDYGINDAEIATAYQLNKLYESGDFGAGQTVALFEEEPFNPTDIAAYQRCYQTSASVSTVNVGSGPGEYKSGEGGESELDIEQVIGLAPKANVIVYQGPAPSSAVAIISAIVSADAAKVISSSWGECEERTEAAAIPAENTLLQEAAAQGQSFFISSGDSGAEQCSQRNTGERQLSVLNPAGQPFATGVGGTTLIYPGNAEKREESVWNDGSKELEASPYGGSGGGISVEFGMPGYQASAAASLGVVKSGLSSGAPCHLASGDCREVPDVSADADLKTGYMTFTNGQWGPTGGTSAAAPLWAALTALANSSSACRGVPVGFANPSLYQLAGSAYSSDFHDVTKASFVTGQASNDIYWGSPYETKKFPVETGYDMATGLGTPDGENLVPGLCALAAPVYTVTVNNPGPQTATVGSGVALQISGSDSGGAGLSYSASGLPAGLSISASGLITGTPTTVGTITATVAAGDGHANSGAAQFAWTVKPAIGPPTVSRASLGGIAKRKPRIAFTITQGSNAPALKSIAVALPSGLAFSKSSRSLSKGVAVYGANGKRVKFTLKLSRGVLTISLKSAASKIQVTITSPAVSVGPSLASKVKRRKVKSLSLVVTAVDASHGQTRLVASAKPS